LTAIAGSPFAAGIRPTSIAVDPSGHFAYVANYNLNCTPSDVSAYTIDGTTGALAPVSLSPFAAGVGTVRVTVDPSGRFVYTTNNCSDDVSAYSINAATG